MTNPPSTNETSIRQTVHERLGIEAASDHEVEVMLSVLQEQYPQQDPASLSEGDWLRAYGLMHQRKQTGWMTEGVARPNPEA